MCSRDDDPTQHDAPAPGNLEDILAEVAAMPCIRMFWGARRTCPEYNDGRSLCPTCKVRMFLVPPAEKPIA